MGVFSRFEPIEILSFVETIKDDVEDLGKYKWKEVHILEYFQSEYSKDAFQSR